MADSPTPPAAVLQAMGIRWDPSKYSWDPVTGTLTDRTDGGSWNFGNGGADPSLGTNVVTPQGTQNFAQGTTPIFSDVGNAAPFGLPTADAYNWYADQKAGNQKDFLAAAAGLIGGPLLAGALSGAGGAASGGVGDAGATGYGISPDFLAGGAGNASSLLPGYGVLAPTTGIPSTFGGAALAGAGLPADLGGAGSFASLASSTLAPGGGVLAPALGSVGGGLGGGLGSVNSSNLFSGGADPGAPPNLAAPGAQTPGGYGLPSGTQIPNLPGANMASLPSWLQSLLPYSSLIGGGLGLVDSLLQPDQKTTTQGGTSNSTNTSSLQLPSQLTGGAGGALDRANQLLSQGYQVAPLGSAFNTAQDQLTNLPQNNAPTTSSFASGANINPYLDMTFNAAADATQNRLATEFANAGQLNSPQDQQARSQQLQQLAAGIYGPGYQNAQQLQYGAQESGVTRGLQQQDANINRTLQANPLLQQLGMTQQQQAQAQLNAPATGLNQYIGQLGGLSPYFPGTTNQSQSTNQTGNVTQPLYNNPLSSVAGGAILGNYVGNIFGPQQQGNSYAGLQKPQQMTSQPVTGQWY
jgi:hypothetical protein